MSYSDWLIQAFASLGGSVLPITVAYAAAQAVLPGYHRDPFDRLLIAQALVEGIPLVSNDPIFEQYGVIRIW